MAFLTDRQIIEALIPVRFLSSVVFNGVADPSDPEARQLLDWLKASEKALMTGRTDKEAVKLTRRSWSAYDRAMEPYVQEATSCTKFGLIVFYLMAELEAQGIFLFEPGSPFDQAQQALYGPEGSIVELTEMPAVDASAQKQARRLLRQLQADGYFREALAA